MNATNVYGEASGMSGLLVLRVLAQIVVRHDAKAEPYRKSEAQSPRKNHAPEHPVGHAEDEGNGGRIALVTHQVAGRHAPDQRHEPDGQQQPAFAARMAEELLLFAGIAAWFGHRWGP